MSKRLIVLVSVLGVAILAVLMVVNMNHHDSTSDTGVDSAFVSEMVPHHEGAIRMAKLAEARAEHPEIVTLAEGIISSQNTEIDQMNRMRQRLSGEDGQHAGMGMSDSMMGMDMDMAALKNARPFDREFIDQMIPHHQGAIYMARMALSDGNDQEVKDLAEAIIVAQSAEIEQMNEWRMKWYGAASPAGGVPVEEPDDSGHDMDSMGSMDH